MKEILLMLSPLSLILFYSIIETIKKKKEEERLNPSLKKAYEKWQKELTINDFIEFWTYMPGIPPLPPQLRDKFVFQYKEGLKTSYEPISQKGYVWFRTIEKKKRKFSIFNNVPAYKVKYYYVLPTVKNYQGEDLKSFADFWFEYEFIGIEPDLNISQTEKKRKFLSKLFPPDPPFPPDKPPSLMSGGVL